MAKGDKSDKNWFGRHKIITGLLIVIVIAIVASAAGGGSKSKDNSSNSSTASNSNAKQASQEAAVAKVGQQAKDGKFQFVVNSVKCGETTVGTSQYLQKTAQGQYCRVNLSITNIGDKAQPLSGDDQKLVDGSGKQYSYDSSATLYAAPDSSSSTWFSQINPGNTVTGDLLYDVPAGTAPVTAELHDSAFSGGVKVNLQ